MRGGTSPRSLNGSCRVHRETATCERSAPAARARARSRGEDAGLVAHRARGLHRRPRALAARGLVLLRGHRRRKNAHYPGPSPPRRQWRLSWAFQAQGPRRTPGNQTRAYKMTPCPSRLANNSETSLRETTRFQGRSLRVLCAGPALGVALAPLRRFGRWGCRRSRRAHHTLARGWARPTEDAVYDCIGPVWADEATDRSEGNYREHVRPRRQAPAALGALLWPFGLACWAGRALLHHASIQTLFLLLPPTTIANPPKRKTFAAAKRKRPRPARVETAAVVRLLLYKMRFETRPLS